MKTAEEWIELAAIEYSKHGQKNRLDFIRAIQQDAMSEALIKQLGEALLLAMRGAELNTTIENSFDIDDALIAYNNYLRERGE